MLDDELQSVTAPVTRQHTVVLCCAQSVVELVEEVARNLRGLGFDVQVICGAEARQVLLGSARDRDAPTIYVVCVQGTLKEQVLKPLRQALATHGGPNHHLFVAVLDLALPLAMVGQIRRFAEALERPMGRRRRDGLGERRQWREQLGPHGDRVATRSYRAVGVQGPSASQGVPGPIRRSGPQTVIGNATVARIGATDKYRAVTGALPSIADATEPSDESRRRRRKAHAPKVRVRAVNPAKPRRSTPAPDAIAAPDDAPTIQTTPAQTGDTVVTGAPQPTAGHTPSVPLLAETLAPPPTPLAAPMPMLAEPPRSRAPLFVALALLLVGGAGVAAWSTGMLARWTGSNRGEVASAGTVARSTAKSEPAAQPESAPPAKREPTLAAAPTPVAEPEPTPSAPPEPTAPAVEPTAPAVEPTAPQAAAPPLTADTPPPPDEPSVAAQPPVEVAPAQDDDEPTLTSPAASSALDDAVARRKLRATDTLYVTLGSAAARSWADARSRCEALEVEGVAGFRLPYRRELQLLDAIGLLPDEPHWSRTVPDDDTTAAFVLHPSTGQLVVWHKDEPAASVCVRSR
ncbi:MAG: hypothetical protein K1X88_32910 [Nannocystaceae bacterium]|nr:hypothetical protein [Nannocystaceae bacterium]